MTSIGTCSKRVIYPEYCHALSPTLGKWCPLWATDLHALEDVGMFCDGRRLLHFGNHPIKWVRITGVIVAIDHVGKGSNFKKIYTLDDSSGSCVECSAMASAPDPRAIEGSTNVPQFSNQNVNKNLACEDKIEEKDRNSGERRHTKHNKNTLQVNQVEAATPSVLKPSIPWNEVDIGTVAKIKGRVAIWWDRKRVEIVKVEILKCTELEVKCWNEVREFRKEILEIPWRLTRNEKLHCKRFKERKMEKLLEESEKKRSKGE